MFDLEKIHQGYSDSDLEGKVECNICFSVAGNERERFGLVVLESSANSDLGCDGEHAIGSYFVSSSYKYRLKHDVTVYAPFGFSLQKYVSGSKLDPSDFIFDDDDN